jgi:hypothetical protein
MLTACFGGYRRLGFRMQDLWWQLKATDSFTVYTAVGFSVVVCWFIHEIVKSPMLAWISTPLLAAGGVLSPTLLANNMITLSYDRMINTVAAVALGTLVTLLTILVGTWFWTLCVEHRVKRTKLAALPTRAPRIRR